MVLLEVSGPELQGSGLFVSFKESNEVGGVVEIEQVCDLIHRLFRVQYIPFCFQQHLSADVITGAFTGLAAADDIQLLAGSVQFGRKIIHIPEGRASFGHHLLKAVVKRIGRAFYIFGTRKLEQFGKYHAQISVDDLIRELTALLVLANDIIENKTDSTSKTFHL